MPSCFVIGPIGDRFADTDSPARVAYEDALQVLETIIEPACQANEIEPVRADQISASGDINEQVFRHLRDDDIVIADVSGGNSNVMYELGARHTTNKLTIQIGEYGQLPFDIQSIRTINFSRSRRGLIDARNELIQAIATGLAEGPEELPLFRVWSRSDYLASETGKIRTEGTEGAEAGGIESDNAGDLDALEQIALAERTFPEFTRILSDMTETVEEMAALVQDASEASNRADARSGTASARLIVLGKLAKDLDQPTSELQTQAVQYDESLRKLDGAMRVVFANFDTYPDQLHDEGASAFFESIKSLAAASRDSMEHVNSFGGAAEGMAGASRRLRVPGQRISKAVKRMAAATATIDEWDRKVGTYIAEVESGSADG